MSDICVWPPDYDVSLRAQGVSMVLYPLTAFRAMSRAAATVYASVIRERHQAKVVPLMQTREGIAFLQNKTNKQTCHSSHHSQIWR